MYRNILTLWIRHLRIHALHNAVNVLGISIGMAAAILMILFVRAELSYDDFISDADRIHIVGTEIVREDGGTVRDASSSFSWGPAFMADHPEAVERVVRLAFLGPLVQAGDLKVYESFRLVDPDFFAVLDFPFLHGDPATALTDPSAVVITETLARKYFNETNAIGRTFILDGDHVVRVTGVLKDQPDNTHLRLAMVAPINSVVLSPDHFGNTEDWTTLCCRTYVKFREGADIERTISGADEWMRLRAPIHRGASGDTDRISPDFRPLRTINADPVRGERGGVSVTELTVAIAIAFLVLTIAAMNFMNLSTARATQRAKEVSLRRVAGASRRQIQLQFFGESVLLAMLGLVVGLALAEALLPSFSGFTGQSYSIDFGSIDLVLSLVGLTLIVGLIGGSYPALIVSRCAPAAVLKGGRASLGTGVGSVQQILVVLQFAISISLMVAAAVVFAQYRFTTTKDLGFDKEDVFVSGFWTQPGVTEQREIIIDRLREDPRILGVALADFVPGSGDGLIVSARLAGEDARNTQEFRAAYVGAGFFEVLGIERLAGRAFDESRSADQVRPAPGDPTEGPRSRDAGSVSMSGGSVILNETASRRLGFAAPADALGQTVAVTMGTDGTVQGTVIGVVKDFHANSLHEPINPTVFLMDPGRLHTMFVRFRPGQAADGWNSVERIWRDQIQDRPLQGYFLGDSIERRYLRGRKMAQVFAVFSGIAVFIACMGLFGLAAFTAERRTKEIGIRRVLGASITDVFRLLLWQFSKPVLIANLVAWPFAWIALSRWLEGFAYRTELDPLLFAGSGAAALLIAWITLAAHTLKVARRSPVAALRQD